MLDFRTGETLTGKEFKLDWTNTTDYAQVEFIDLDYFEALEGKYCYLLEKLQKEVRFRIHKIILKVNRLFRGVNGNLSGIQRAIKSKILTTF